MDKAGKLTILSKVERVPGDSDTVLYSYKLSGLRISGGEQWGLFFYQAKFEGVKYQKMYIDISANRLLGKRTEMEPWEQLVEFVSKDLVQL